MSTEKPTGKLIICYESSAWWSTLKYFAKLFFQIKHKKRKNVKFILKCSLESKRAYFVYQAGCCWLCAFLCFDLASDSTRLEVVLISVSNEALCRPLIKQNISQYKQDAIIESHRLIYAKFCALSTHTHTHNTHIHLQCMAGWLAGWLVQNEQTFSSSALIESYTNTLK